MSVPRHGAGPGRTTILPAELLPVLPILPILLLLLPLLGCAIVPALGAQATLPAPSPDGAPHPSSRGAAHDRTVVWSFENTTGVVTADNITLSGGSARLLPLGGVGWAPRGNSTIPRNAHTLAEDTDAGLIYSVTGHGAGFTHLTTLHAYDPDSRTWTPKASLPARGRMLSGFGYWPVVRQMILAGGHDGSLVTFNETWRYTPALDNWTRIGDLPVPLHSAVMMYDPVSGTFLVWAGCQDRFYRYAPANDTWTPLPSAPGAKFCVTQPEAGAGYSHAVLDPVRREVIVFGGLMNSSAASFATWRYGLATGNWTGAAAIPHARYDGAAFYDADRARVVAIGGKDEAGGFPPPATYDPTNDTWNEQPKVAGMDDRYYLTALWDSGRHRGTLFGGWGTTTILLEDVWVTAPLVAPAGFLLLGTVFEPEHARLDAVGWAAATPPATTLTVAVRSSPDGSTGWSAWETVPNGGTAAAPADVDRHLQLRISWTSDGYDATPVLDDLLVASSVNRPPRVGAGPDGTAAKGQIRALLATADDTDGDALTVLWLQQAGPPTGVANASVLATSFTPAATGAYTFEVRVTDPFGATANDTVVMTVANRRPVATAEPDQEVYKGALVLLKGNGSDPDPGDALQFLWVQTVGPPTVLLNATGRQASFAAADAGNYTFALTVSDGEDGSEPASQRVTVRSRAPGAVLAVDATAVPVNGSVVFDASASRDPDGRIVSFLYAFGDGTTSGWVGQETMDHRYTAAGNRTATLRVRDDDGVESAPSAGILITVRPPGWNGTGPLPPVAVLRLLTKAPYAGRAVAFDGSLSSDPDGSVVAYRFDFGDGSTSEWGPAAAVEHRFPRAGTYIVTLRVRDDNGTVSAPAAAATLEVTVAPPPRDTALAGALLPFGILALVVAATVAALVFQRRRPAAPPRRTSRARRAGPEAGGNDDDE